MKYRSTTRTANNRGRWLRALGVMGAAALGCYATTAASAIKTDIGLEYRATGYVVQSDAFDTPTTGPSDDGFAHYLRIKANFKSEKTGISVHTSINVLGDRWEGDVHNFALGPPGPGQQAVTNASNESNALYVDYAYVQVPTSIGLFRVGRQTSNWNNCFLVCQDRRDRILYLTKLGKTTVIAGYDRRADNDSFENKDDGDQFFAGFIMPFAKDWQLGFLYVHWLTGDNTEPVTGYVLQGVDMISPYVQGSLGMLNLALGVTYVWSGERDLSAAPAFGPGQIFTDESFSGYFRIGADLGMLELKAQYVTAQDGGLVAAGFDTYSSLINNNPASTQNPTTVYRMGGALGLEGFNESLYIGNATVNLTPKFAVGASVGYLDVEVPTAAGQKSDGSMVYDLQASYQVNDALRIWGTLGYLAENNVATLSGNSVINPLPSATFKEDGVLAASISMGVKF